MGRSSAQRVFALIAIFAVFASAASSQKDDTRDQHQHSRTRPLLRSASDDRRRHHHRRGRRRAEIVDVVHQTEPKFDDICINPVAKFDVRDALADLKANRRKFGDLQDYDMRIQRTSFSIEECTDPFNVTVRAGIIVNATSDKTKMELNVSVCGNLPTIADIFQKIEIACDTPYAELTVVYHDDMGYPAYTRLDENLCIADDERDYTVTDLVDMTPVEDGKGKEGGAPGQKDKPDDKPGKPGSPSRRV